MNVYKVTNRETLGTDCVEVMGTRKVLTQFAVRDVFDGGQGSNSSEREGAEGTTNYLSVLPRVNSDPRPVGIRGSGLPETPKDETQRQGSGPDPGRAGGSTSTPTSVFPRSE